MMQNIQSSQRFKTEYEDFRSRIAKVDDQSLQNELTNKLLKLKEMVVYLDRQHEALLVSNKLGDVSETRSDIVAIRKYIKDSLENYERAQIKI